LASEMSIYFCDPHSPWQRGSNENTNGLLRQYFPKGTDLSVHSAGRLIEVAAELNARPRKTLGMKTPAEMMQQLLFGPLAPHRCDDRLNPPIPSGTISIRTGTAQDRPSRAPDAVPSTGGRRIRSDARLGPMRVRLDAFHDAGEVGDVAGVQRVAEGLLEECVMAFSGFLDH